MTCNLTSVKKGMGTPKSFLEYYLKGFDLDLDKVRWQSCFMLTRYHDITEQKRKLSRPFLGKKV